ncbi:WD40-repeat-containing domain protein [Fimicolochytrium jonesii]|uniref:WD40-repeat-containing domain protein n=1 Tax=Fimicolochytrium jonesii TaxID=1396493 RepID=UPI0022FF39E8|nr:WD40-repeat-containing domain protein [Fimicolochytrium jonesii]KAI8816790.1 WD40-repeat-containing domain protein [Fimicolochytrium jonesii]
MLKHQTDGSALGPHYSSDAENFFQSDRDLEIARAREQKKTQLSGKKAPGNPYQLTSKVLAFSIVENIPAGAAEYAYIAESGHVARKIELKARGHSGPVTTVAVVHDASGNDVQLFTGSWDKTVKKWDVKTGVLLATLEGHSDFVKRVITFHKWIFSASSDSTIRQWDIATGACVRVFKDHNRAVEDLVIAEDGLHIFSGSSDTSIKKWNIATGQVVENLTGHQTSVYALQIAEGSLWSVSADKTAKRWDLETNIADSTFEHPDFVRSLCVFPGGAHLATGCRDENVRIWDVGTEKCVKVLTGHFGEVSDIKLRGSTLWTASLDGTIRSWAITRKFIWCIQLALTFVINHASINVLAKDLEKGASTAEEPLKIQADEQIIPKAKSKWKKEVKMTAEEEQELADLMGDDE